MLGDQSKKKKNHGFIQNKNHTLLIQITCIDKNRKEKSLMDTAE